MVQLKTFKIKICKLKFVGQAVGEVQVPLVLRGEGPSSGSSENLEAAARKQNHILQKWRISRRSFHRHLHGKHSLEINVKLLK